MAKKKKGKVIYECWLCKRYFREGDIFKVRLERDILIGEFSPLLQHQSNSVRVCRGCIGRAGYARKKEQKVERGLLVDASKIIEEDTEKERKEG